MTRSFLLMKPVLILLLLSAALFTASCKKINYHKLTDEDMSWLVYKNYQIDEFDNGNESVKFLVTLRTKSYYDNDDSANEFTTASFKQLNDTTAIHPDDSYGLLYIYKPSDDGLLVTFSWPHFPLKGVPLTSLPPGIVTIGGVTYTDVFVLDATGFTDARNKIRKVWYSKSAGVLQFEDTIAGLWVKNL